VLSVDRLPFGIFINNPKPQVASGWYSGFETVLADCEKKHKLPNSRLKAIFQGIIYFLVHPNSRTCGFHSSEAFADASVPAPIVQ
jgi:hypothetical protein